MPKLVKFIFDTLSVRLSIWVVSFVALLFVATLSIMFHFSRRAIKAEALAKAEQTLEETVLNIDLILNKVEVATNIMHWNVEHHLDHPEAMETYCRQLVENNPTIIGCTIGMEPGFYPSKGKEFVTYAYRKDASDQQASNQAEIIQTNHHGNTSYLTQNWYTIIKDLDYARWLKTRETSGNAKMVVSYCMPIHDTNGKLAGIMAADISIDWFSQTILEAKPFPNSYCAMIGLSGTYIIHPDTVKLHSRSVYDLSNAEEPEMAALLKAISDGETGHKTVEVDGQKCYVFYRPFYYKGWVATIVCPVSDVLGTYQGLQTYTLIIAIAGLLILLTFCLYIIGRALRPVIMLNSTVKRISQGKFDEPIPNTWRRDEIGSLQTSFQAMQRSIAHYVEDIRQTNDRLKESNEALRIANEEANESERVKNAFIQNVTDQMITPVNTVEELAGHMRKNYEHITQAEAAEQIMKLQEQTSIITKLIDRMLEMAQKKGGEA